MTTSLQRHQKYTVGLPANGSDALNSRQEVVSNTLVIMTNLCGLDILCSSNHTLGCSYLEDIPITVNSPEGAEVKLVLCA